MNRFVTEGWDRQFYCKEELVALARRLYSSQVRSTYSLSNCHSASDSSSTYKCGCKGSIYLVKCISTTLLSFKPSPSHKASCVIFRPPSRSRLSGVVK